MGISEALLFRGYGVTGQAKPYVRVYYSVMDDPKFRDIYDDDRALATWLRLLLIADAMYPAPANLPRRVNDVTLKKLIDAGLVDIEQSDRYRIHGLVAEREHRSEHARKGARALHEQRSGSAISEPSRAETNQAKPVLSIAEPEPYVTLTDDEKEARKQRERDEFNTRTMARLGVRP